jgi:LacI family gluconate utilization system Gnt-I transcriptional repressor
MRDVAARARVSAMTVSRALRDPSLITPTTHRRIAQAMREMGYVPNALASGLRSTNQSKVVAAIVPSLRNSLFAETNQGLSDELREQGINLMVGDSHTSEREAGDLIIAFLAQRPCGIVVHDAVRSTRVRNLLRRSGIPVVEVGDLNPRPLDTVVSYSNRGAAQAMTEHLIGRGYRRIGFASLSPAVTARARARLDGYKAALKDAGLKVEPSLIALAEPGFSGGAAALVTLVAAGSDAIFFAGDVLAIGAVLECQRRGWTIPDRVAIASFDDHEIAAQLTPALTTLKLPRYEIGRRAARLIVARNNGSANLSPAINDLGFEVIPRQST